MATLTEDVKAFIVQALACFDTPSQVSAAVKEEFGVEVARMQVAAYDPTKQSGKGMAKKWKEIFAATRKQFLEETGAIPIANQSFRLRALQKLYEKTERRGNVVVAADLIEQAAKEVGGMFVNKMRGESEDPDPPQPHTFTYQVQDARRPAAEDDSDQPDS
ncbi:DUF2280 domain-containing protein [Robbsia andropogonis]|uniref:DUF2280 domain-containing protein n=1 Tax=Robbsia andropogonis TaxID=28092 RepID=UPI00209D4842|nr:DUF2280 domain-containing protein [Robbsia andropogonis]MCP1119643.1 DUF2280 domain-containing protein [Robbsia andropogonis]MCP1129626.1 DUF2280 domain-containing protein [Robbsia andropogonis]